MHEDADEDAEEHAGQHVRQEVNAQVEAREGDEDRDGEGDQADIRKEKEDHGRSREGRSGVAGRERIISRMGDDRVDPFRDVKRTTAFREILDDQIAEKGREEERPEGRVGDGSIGLEDEERTDRQEPDNTEITGHRDQWHEDIARAVTHVLVNPVQHS